jgi:uncharacterized protein YraI
MSGLVKFALAIGVLAMLPTAALAANATAAQTLNVRTGPATSYPVIDQLGAGDTVDVKQCEGGFCQILSGSKSGWVSANFLTRDVVAKPVTPPAAPSTGVASAPLPTIPPTKPTPPVKPATTTASTTTLPKPSSPAFPPAYAGSNSSTVTLPPARISNQASLPVRPDKPRPKANIPDVSGDAYDGGDDYADAPDMADAPVDPAYDDGYDDRGWRPFGGPGNFGRWRARQEMTDGDAACFMRPNGAPAFCVRDGQRLADVARWSGRPLILRNPSHLEVTVCTDSGYHDCQTYTRGGPVSIGDGVGDATVSASAGGY